MRTYARIVDLERLVFMIRHDIQAKMLMRPLSKSIDTPFNKLLNKFLFHRFAYYAFKVTVYEK